jgi:hypothetical protein
VLSTVTAKIRPPALLLPARPPALKVQVLPALLLGVQAQPGVLAAGLKVVLAGTCTLITTPVAPTLPAFV